MKNLGIFISVVALIITYPDFVVRIFKFRTFKKDLIEELKNIREVLEKIIKNYNFIQDIKTPSFFARCFYILSLFSYYILNFHKSCYRSSFVFIKLHSYKFNSFLKIRNCSVLKSIYSSTSFFNFICH